MHALVEAAEVAFAPLVSRRRVKKGASLARPGEHCGRLYLVRSGLLRSFHVVEAREVNAHFAFEGGIVGAVDSIVHGRPTRYGIDALEDTECAVLEYTEVEAYLERDPQHERIARQLTQALYADLVERFEGMLFLSAKERYDHLLARCPGISQRVGLGHIASYLGMTQETLSRVRSER